MAVVGSAAAFVLLMIGVLHVVWMFSPWPFATPAEMARTVAGVETDAMPTRKETGTVAVLILVAACLVGTRAGTAGAVDPFRLVSIGTWGVAAVLLGRGAIGFAVFSPRKDVFGRMDRWVYSPLCVALAGGCVAAAFS
ncbi:uncharacterized protein DUF3995 [Murinocardiopsis flavida]|uniref:Uncharacterized protein DUF3995 n=1 Tax=Murinocardiopsis flavida TaxID=645275 RepID=A0A2P8DQ81_9ACTN|nr:DUF3995 domain-containing protein [Murinocardiopsis flavida]PSK99387.1 uncharacterized protein DUF3995 [Murinocardiopsis flavida]